MHESLILQIPPLSEFLIDILIKMALAGLILLVTWIVSKILGSTLFKATSRLGHQVAHQIKRAVSWTIGLIGILVCLQYLGLELTILVAILVLGGVALIVAFRDILLNMASREAITVYNPFKIGDWIQVDEYFGRVVDVNLMNTVLVTLDNEIVHIPNSKIVNSMLVNRTAPGEIRIHVPLTVDNTVDLSKVEEILIEIGNELKDDLAPDSKPEFRVIKIDDRSVQLEFLFKINNPAKSRLITSEVLKRAKNRLDGIQREM